MLMLWSQIIYGHRTASISPKAAGKIVRFFVNLLDIARCPVKCRYYLNFHGVRTAFSRVIVGKMTSIGTVRCPDGAPPVFALIGPAPDDFGLKFKSYDLNGDHSGVVRCLAGHRTMSEKRQELSNIS